MASGFWAKIHGASTHYSIAIILFVGSVDALDKPASATHAVRPNPTPDVEIKKGRTLFLNSCAHCHGEDAHGDEGPDLHELEISDRRIVNVIKHGIKGEMPSFAKKHPDEEIALLLAYLRSL
jgi:mono/diheme cytochrome c family protein